MLTVTAAAILVLSGCSSDSSSPEAEAEGSGGGAPVAGGTLVHRVAADPACLDPAQLRLRASLGVMRQVVDSLLYQRLDGGIEPWLAESWTVNEQANEYVFTIREGVTFSDGTALDARVVADNIQALFDMGATASVVAPYLTSFESVTTEGSDVTVVFGTPQAQFLQAVTTPSMGIVGPATLETTPAQRCTQGVIGTGPFVLESYTANEGMQLSKRSGYSWAPESFENQGEAFLDEISVVFIPDSAVGTGMLLSDQAGSSTDISMDDIPRLEEAGAHVVTRPMPGFANSLFMNVGVGVLADDAVRYAILHGVEREIALSASGGVETPASNVISTSTPGWTDHSDLMAYDPEAAEAALDEAGWSVGSDGVREKDSQRLTLRMNYMTPSMLPLVPTMEVMQQQLGELGIEITLNPVTAAEDNERLQAGDYELRYNGLSRGDPDVLRSVFDGMDPELDELLATQAGLTDIQGKRGDVIAEITSRILELALINPISNAVQAQAYSSDVNGVVFDNTNTPSFNNVWLSQ